MWGGSKNHVYVAVLAPRASDAIRFWLDDRKRTDNSGSVRVIIRRTL